MKAIGSSLYMFSRLNSNNHWLKSSGNREKIDSSIWRVCLSCQSTFEDLKVTWLPYRAQQCLCTKGRNWEISIRKKTGTGTSKEECKTGRV